MVDRVQCSDLLAPPLSFSFSLPLLLASALASCYQPPWILRTLKTQYIFVAVWKEILVIAQVIPVPSTTIIVLIIPCFRVYARFSIG